MNLFHADRLLTAYLHGELATGSRQRIERHLAACARCRDLAASLSAVHSALPDLPVHQAPDALWQRVEQALDTSQPGSSRAKPAAALTRTNDTTTADATLARNGRVRLTGRDGASLLPGSWRRHRPTFRYRVAAGITALAVTTVTLFGAGTVLRARRPFWEVRTLQGKPRIGWFAIGRTGKLRVGDQLTTDRSSRAEIKVADIGTVKISPNSTVRLDVTGSSQHRLALERGALDARVTAPPRLFIVDTANAHAVDLGCAYHLETDGAQSTLLRVTYGEVALENPGRSVVVPGGFSCESRRGPGPGSPVKEDAPAALRNAVHRFDFEAGGDAAAEAARRAARNDDAITLLHLISRSSEAERGLLFDTLTRLSGPPPSVTRAGVVRADPIMIDTWRTAMLYDLAELALP